MLPVFSTRGDRRAGSVAGTSLHVARGWSVALESSRGCLLSKPVSLWQRTAGEGHGESTNQVDVPLDVMEYHPRPGTLFGEASVGLRGMAPLVIAQEVRKVRGRAMVMARVHPAIQLSAQSVCHEVAVAPRMRIVAVEIAQWDGRLASSRGFVAVPGVLPVGAGPALVRNWFWPCGVSPRALVARVVWQGEWGGSSQVPRVCSTWSAPFDPLSSLAGSSGLALPIYEQALSGKVGRSHPPMALVRVIPVLDTPHGHHAPGRVHLVIESVPTPLVGPSCHVVEEQIRSVTNFASMQRPEIRLREQGSEQAQSGPALMANSFVQLDQTITPLPVAVDEEMSSPRQSSLESISASRSRSSVTTPMTMTAPATSAASLKGSMMTSWFDSSSDLPCGCVLVSCESDTGLGVLCWQEGQSGPSRRGCVLVVPGSLAPLFLDWPASTGTGAHHSDVLVVRIAGSPHTAGAVSGLRSMANTTASGEGRLLRVPLTGHSTQVRLEGMGRHPALTAVATRWRKSWLVRVQAQSHVAAPSPSISSSSEEAGDRLTEPVLAQMSLEIRSPGLLLTVTEGTRALVHAELGRLNARAVIGMTRSEALRLDARPGGAFASQADWLTDRVVSWAATVHHALAHSSTGAPVVQVGSPATRDDHESALRLSGQGVWSGGALASSAELDVRPKLVVAAEGSILMSTHALMEAALDATRSARSLVLSSASHAHVESPLTTLPMLNPWVVAGLAAACDPDTMEAIALLVLREARSVTIRAREAHVSASLTQMARRFADSETRYLHAMHPERPPEVSRVPRLLTLRLVQATSFEAILTKSLRPQAAREDAPTVVASVPAAVPVVQRRIRLLPSRIGRSTSTSGRSVHPRLDHEAAKFDEEDFAGAPPPLPPLARSESASPRVSAFRASAASRTGPGDGPTHPIATPLDGRAEGSDSLARLRGSDSRSHSATVGDRSDGVQSEAVLVPAATRILADALLLNWGRSTAALCEVGVASSSSTPPDRVVPTLSGRVRQRLRDGVLARQRMFRAESLAIPAALQPVAAILFPSDDDPTAPAGADAPRTPTRLGEDPRPMVSPMTAGTDPGMDDQLHLAKQLAALSMMTARIPAEATSRPARSRNWRAVIRETIGRLAVRNSLEATERAVDALCCIYRQSRESLVVGRMRRLLQSSRSGNHDMQQTLGLAGIASVSSSNTSRVQRSGAVLTMPGIGHELPPRPVVLRRVTAASGEDDGEGYMSDSGPEPVVVGSLRAAAWQGVVAANTSGSRTRQLGSRVVFTRVSMSAIRVELHLDDLGVAPWSEWLASTPMREHAASLAASLSEIGRARLGEFTLPGMDAPLVRPVLPPDVWAILASHLAGSGLAVLADKWPAVVWSAAGPGLVAAGAIAAAAAVAPPHRSEQGVGAWARRAIPHAAQTAALLVARLLLTRPESDRTAAGIALRSALRGSVEGEDDIE